MTSHITITAVSGPAKTVTAGVFSNVTDYFLDLYRELITFKTNGQYKEFELHGVTVITDTITGADHAIVVS
jgi:hypothetical protein